MTKVPPEQGPDARAAEPEAFVIAGTAVTAGRRMEIEIPVERLPTGPQIAIRAIVLHGGRPGPKIAVSAAIHGDEINGVEVIRRLLGELRPEEIAGTVVFMPVVNELGFMAGVRHLPDRGDLNRAFPGNPRGSLAGRIARLMMDEVISRCEYGIDLHCGADARANLPQIRADLEEERTLRCAQAFGAPVLIHASTRDGSLRQAATEAGMAMLLYEGGEANRFDGYAIEAAFDGVLGVLAHLGIVEGPSGDPEPLSYSHKTRWVRAPRSGLFRSEIELGATVERRQVLGHVSDIFGHEDLAVRAPFGGLVIGLANKPIANQGDALVHIAKLEGGQAQPGAAGDEREGGAAST